MMQFIANKVVRFRFGGDTIFFLFFLAMLAGPNPAFADENGISFWLPGMYGSLAAAPGKPGPSIAAFYFHSSLQADKGRTFRYGGRASLDAEAQVDLLAVIPSYTFKTSVLGGQASAGLMIVGANNWVSAKVEAMGSGGKSPFRHRSDSVTAMGDLYPQLSLKWNLGVHNFMAYTTGNIPVGSYNKHRLANVGLGHAAVDAGGGYTYFNPANGWEFSSVLGFTYNFENHHTQYQNGVDAHLDLGASYFFTPQFHAGLVGYYYDQLTADSGSGAKLGDFQSRVAGIGPQFGCIFPVGDGSQGYVNIKAYKEFASEHRPEGWNAWLTLSLSFGGQ